MPLHVPSLVARSVLGRAVGLCVLVCISACGRTRPLSVDPSPPDAGRSARADPGGGQPRPPSAAELRRGCDAGRFDACRALGEPLRLDPLDLPVDVELAEASGRGDRVGVAKLLAEGHAADVVARDGTHVLHTALARGHVDVAEQLVVAGANPNVPAGGPSLYVDDPALLVAMKNGGGPVVRVLLEHGAKVDLPGRHGYTALHEAIYAEDRASIELLLEYGASVRYRAEDGRSAVDMAAGHPDAEVLAWTIEGWGDFSEPPPADEWNPPILTAAHGCHLANVELLLRHGAQVDQRGKKFDDTALIRAAQHGCTEVVARLLRVPGIAIDHQDTRGLSALIGAAGNGHVEITTMLLDAGADPTLKNDRGRTALAQAKAQGARATAALLADRGASLSPSAQAEVDRAVDERWSRRTSHENCRSHDDAQGRRTGLMRCVHADTTPAGMRYAITLEDTSRLDAHGQHPRVAERAITVGAGEIVDVDATWASALRSGGWFVFVPIVQGNPEHFTSLRAEVYLASSLRAPAKKAWASAPCRTCVKQELQLVTDPKGSSTFQYITTDRGGARTVVELSPRGSRLVTR